MWKVEWSSSLEKAEKNLVIQLIFLPSIQL